MAMQEHDRWPSDAALLGRVSRGERPAFEELYDRFVAPVYGLVLAVVDDAEQAEEVVATLFVNLWQSPFDLPSTPGAAPSPFSTRILVAAHRRAVQTVRARRQGSNVEDPFLDDMTAADGLATVRLAYFDARTVGEIAARMEAPRNAVASLLNRGLEDLRGSAPAP